ncbi:alpha/beta hydrolase [Roseomonas aeriglobus]|nr:alpha/beta hydrolase [Roseomonas aeriglobus]
MAIDRRTLLGAGAATLVAGPALAQIPAASERITLWPGRPPGEPAAGVKDVVIQRSKTPGDLAWTSVGDPVVVIARPAKPNGAALLIIPGGGYTRVATRRESSGMAIDLAKRGYTVFELLYRLPHDGWAAGPDAPLQDAQRAIRLIRAGAGKRWAIDPTKIGVMGFSAGGHLAARIATRFALKTYDPVDAADTLSPRPMVAGLFYPVVTMLDDGVHASSRRELLGARSSDAESQRRYSAQLDIPADAAPCFVTTNTDDRTVPAANSLLMYAGLVAAKIPTELHIFDRGGHGPPAPRKNGQAIDWLGMYLAFAADHGLPGQGAAA